MALVQSTEKLTFDQAEAILFDNEPVEIDDASHALVEKSYKFLNDFAKDKIIYGINTGLGPMAQYKVDEDRQIEMQYNLIRSHAAGAGEKIEDRYVKAAMLIRMKAIMQGHSGIHPSIVKLLQDLINSDIYPFIPEHGGVGASGDLVQLAHLALTLIGEGHVTYKGELRKTEEVFKEKGLKPISIKLREGLSLINGTSVMTGIGFINTVKAHQAFNWSMAATAILLEIVESFDDHYSVELNAVKHHRGQQEVAKLMRSMLGDSEMIGRRKDHFYEGTFEDRVFKRKVQEYYSLRCVPQILGPVFDTIADAKNIVEEEMNSVSDNPIVDLETEDVYHGGNFHGDYISLEMDKLKLAVTRISMLVERQMAFLYNPRLNDKLPPFVNLGTLGTNLGMQAAQFTATSTTAENQTLSNSMYVHSITTNNDNQDIVSMGTNSALMTRRVIDNTFQVLSIQMISLLQAIDFLEIDTKLSSFTKDIYKKLRAVVPKFVEDTPKYEEIERMRAYLYENKLNLPQ